MRRMILIFYGCNKLSWTDLTNTWNTVIGHIKNFLRPIEKKVSLQNQPKPRILMVSWIQNFHHFLRNFFTFSTLSSDVRVIRTKFCYWEIDMILRDPSVLLKVDGRPSKNFKGALKWAFHRKIGPNSKMSFETQNLSLESWGQFFDEKLILKHS